MPKPNRVHLAHRLAPLISLSYRQRSTKRQEEKARKDPVKSKRPDLPLGMKGTGGRVTGGGSTLHSWMAKQISVKNKDDHINPR